MREDITLKEARKIKENAEARILDVINEEIRNLERQAGANVKHVVISLVDSRALVDSRRNRHVVKDVNLELDVFGEEDNR